MGFFSYFAAREIGRAMSAGERREMAKFRRDMQKSDAAMALSAQNFLSKVRYRSVLGHPEFLQNPAADPQRWWERIERWADLVFETLVEAAVAFLVFILVLLLLYTTRPTSLNVFTFVVIFIGVVGLMHEAFSSHLWRPVVRWVNWQFKKQGWPVERMLADLKVEENAERSATEEAARTATRPLRVAQHQADQAPKAGADLPTEAHSRPRTFGHLHGVIQDLLSDAEMDESLDVRAFAVRAAEAAGLAASFAPPHEDESDSVEWREVASVIDDVIEAAAGIMTLKDHDVSRLMQLLLVLESFLGEVDQQR